MAVSDLYKSCSFMCNIWNCLFSSVFHSHKMTEWVLKGIPHKAWLGVCEIILCSCWEKEIVSNSFNISHNLSGIIV
jgi:hypothetical protein